MIVGDPLTAFFQCEKSAKLAKKAGDGLSCSNSVIMRNSPSGNQFFLFFFGHLKQIRRRKKHIDD